MFALRSDRTSAIVFTVLVLGISTVLFMMLVVTREGYMREGWRRLGMSTAGFRYWPLALITTAESGIAHHRRHILVREPPGHWTRSCANT
ncbi:hypothetical protein [Nocardia sp. NPDC060249]|uniref:hypothetical protein n=1 Tax=Nocardia sp. NPDC060249 TaxID=3347082 RepID=UPI003651D299